MAPSPGTTARPTFPPAIGHVPGSVPKSKEFLKGFPAEERAAALRPFMIRYKLFPETAEASTRAYHD